MCRAVVWRLGRISWPRRLLGLSAPKVHIHTLPTELLQLVFEHAAVGSVDRCDTVNTKLVPALMGTCQRFRAVALDTPFIWSFVTFEWTQPCYTGDGEPVPRIFNRHAIELHLRRSKETAFHLLILLEEAVVAHRNTWTAETMHSAESLISDSIEELKSLLLPHMHRCYKVELVSFEMDYPLIPLRFPPFFPLTGRMPKLRTIVHEGGRNAGGPLFDSDTYVPALQSIVCRNAPLFEPRLFSAGTSSMPVDQLSNLTTLDIQSFKASRLDTLEECARLPKLQHLRLTYDHYEGGVLEVGTARRIHFPELQVLVLRGASTSIWIKEISAPRLKILDISRFFRFPYFLAWSQFPLLETFNFRDPLRLNGETFEFIFRHQALLTLTLHVDYIKRSDWHAFFARQGEREHSRPFLLRCCSTPSWRRLKRIEELARFVPTIEHISVEWIDWPEIKRSSAVDNGLVSESALRWKWSTDRAEDDIMNDFFRC